MTFDINIIIGPLKFLDKDQTPEFGIMTPQHMVEHLIITLKLSTGRISYPSFESSDKALAAKKKLLCTEAEMAKGIKYPGDDQKLSPLKYPTLEDAKNALIKAWDNFFLHFESNPDYSSVHPVFGAMDFDEWKLFHHKHIKHHFTQFGIWGKEN